MPKWIDEKSTFGCGPNAISYGQDMPDDISLDRLQKLQIQGKVGDLPLAIEDATKAALMELRKYKKAIAKINDMSPKKEIKAVIDSL